jgi:uncharacterized membrane protein YraQ (UPF0718 family)
MDFLIALWDYIVLSAPYLLFGFLASGILREYFNVEWIKKNLGKKGVGTIVKASAFGVPLPLCSCAVIPAAVTLKKQGASNAATSSFLISTPESGVDSIMMTYGVMDLPMTIIRPISAFMTAFVAGIGQHLFNNETIVIEEETKSCCSKSKKLEQLSFAGRLKRVWSFSTGDLVEDIASWLSIGLICGALINYAVPEELFAYGNGIIGKLIILGIGIPFYICASASTPIAASMVMKGMSPGTALIFLLVGPATNVANLAVLQKYIGKKGVLINIIAIAIVSFVLSFIVDGLYSHYSWDVMFAISEVHEHGSPLWHHLLGVALVFLLLKGLYNTKIKNLFTSSKKSCH